MSTLLHSLVPIASCWFSERAFIYTSYGCSQEIAVILPFPHCSPAWSQGRDGQALYLQSTSAFPPLKTAG